MKTCFFCRMFWDKLGYNIEFGINITRWLFGFGWVSGEHCIHFNIGPIALTFYKNLD